MSTSMSAEPVLAHGMSGGPAVPLAFEYAVVGAGAAVLFSFVVVSVLQRDSVLRGGASGRALPVRAQRVLDGRVVRLLLRTVGLAGAALFFAAAAYGPTDPNVNPAPGLVYVFLWFGLIPLSLIFGPVWKLLNPLRTVHALVAAIAGLPTDRGLVALPRWVGYWPAAVGMLAFTWVELVAPAGDQPRVLLSFFVLYTLGHIAAAGVFGSCWFDRADTFEAYSTLTGRLAPLGRRTDGRLALRNPFDGLDSIRPDPGLVSLVCVWLGSTAYDGFTRSALWRSIVTTTVEADLVALNGDSIRLVGFLLSIALVAGLYLTCTALSTRLGTAEGRAVPRQFAHSLIPIAIGYTVAHYFTLAMFAGQRTIALASDPLDNGSDLFGTDGLQPNYTLLSSTAIAFVQVGAVVIGHIVGVVAAHDRAARLFPRRQAVTGQVPLLVLMVTYTVCGLSLLFAAA